MEVRIKRIYRRSTCHIKREWSDQQRNWSETWCGKRRFIEKDYIPDQAEDKALEQKVMSRPWKHCEKCVKARKLAEPGWVPKEMP